MGELLTGRASSMNWRALLLKIGRYLVGSIPTSPTIRKAPITGAYFFVCVCYVVAAFTPHIAPSSIAVIANALTLKNSPSSAAFSIFGSGKELIESIS